jgi:hypothetical protein
MRWSGNPTLTPPHLSSHEEKPGEEERRKRRGRGLGTNGEASNDVIYFLDWWRMVDLIVSLVHSDLVGSQ